MPDTKLSTLKAKATLASPGPWSYIQTVSDRTGIIDANNVWIAETSLPGRVASSAKANGQFLASVDPTYVLAMVNAIELVKATTGLEQPILDALKALD